MGRYTGPACRRCRQVGEKLFLKGDRCYTAKCAIERRRTSPGVPSARRRRVSDYGLHLREKQKMRYSFGIMESQFRRYIVEALKSPSVTGEVLVQLLERRLDNVVYRLNFAESRRQARQLVRHGHFNVGGHSTNIPSYQLKPGDSIAWKETRKKRDFFITATDGIPRRPVPEWLALDTNTMTGTVVRNPEDSELKTDIDTRLIVEYYSR